MLIQIQKEFLHHLLYVMDGVLTRDEYLKDYPKDYDGTIPKVTYETSFDQVKVAKVNAEGCISFCINSIKDRPIYLIYPKGATGISPVAPLNYWELSTSFPETEDIGYLLYYSISTFLLNINICSYLIAIMADRGNNFQQVMWHFTQRGL